jgi:replicative DNA helicase
MLEIASIARRHKRRQGLRLLVIDYLQQIEPDNRRDPRHEQIASISRRVKTLARELDIPVLCLAQLNRQTEDGKSHEPKLSHLRESGAIEQDADAVLFVHRPGYYTRDEVAPGCADEAKVIVAKQRNGRTGAASLLWFGSYVRFDDPANERLERESEAVRF